MNENPIPSTMVYFDEKEKKAVLCLDKGHPPTMVEACNKGGAFHTHSWVPLGWVDETTFMTDRPRMKDIAAWFVHEVMRGMILIRNEFDRMRHERDEVRKINTKLGTIIRSLTTEMNSAIPYVESEKIRGKLFAAISKAQTHCLDE